MFEPLHGVNTALFTPFDSDGRLSVSAFEELVSWQLGCGVRGFFVCGSTGEGLLLSMDERRQVAEAAVRVASGRAAVMVHVGALATPDSVTLARHAEAIGADAVSSIAPIYYPLPFETVLTHYKAVGAATELPFFVYHIPQMTGTALSMDTALRLTEIPHLEGMKFTDPALYVMRWIYETTGERLTMLSGPDELHLPALTLGAHGAIGTSYNLLPGAFMRLREAYHAGDIATASDLQIRCNRVILRMIQGGGLGAFKAAAKLVGQDLGSVRGPLRTLSPAEEATLFSELERAGFQELAAM